MGLLRRCNVDEGVLRKHQKLTMRLHGLLPPAQIGGGSAGLPVALAVLAIVAEAAGTTTRLGAPQMATTGALKVREGRAELKQMSHEIVAAKLSAVREDGRFEQLLSRSAGGRLAGLVAPGGESLESAAAACWGEAWYEFKRDSAEAHLNRMDWTFTCPIDVDDPTSRHVPVAVEDDLLEHFTGPDGDRVAVIGGWPGTGKTHVVAGLAHRLRGIGWQVLYTIPAGERLVPDAMGSAMHAAANLADLLRPLIGPAPAGCW